jgi:pimeloyl-ACP methyl ester carboxylesterase
VVQYIDEPTALIAQSMGGVIAARAALERPDMVTRLVLSVTSGGIDALDSSRPTRSSFQSDLSGERAGFSNQSCCSGGMRIPSVQLRSASDSSYCFRTRD